MDLQRCASGISGVSQRVNAARAVAQIDFVGSREIWRAMITQAGDQLSLRPEGTEINFQGPLGRVGRNRKLKPIQETNHINAAGRV